MILWILLAYAILIAATIVVVAAMTEKGEDSLVLWCGVLWPVYWAVVIGHWLIKLGRWFR